MLLPSTEEIIRRLKAEKEKMGYSVPQIQQMCEEQGYYVCINTMHSVFCKGSECGSFSYEHTLRPIANVLLRNTELVDIENKQLELLTAQLQREREEHRKNIEHLDKQIKSQRKTIAEKDKFIQELMKNQ